MRHQNRARTFFGIRNRYLRQILWICVFGLTGFCGCRLETDSRAREEVFQEDITDRSEAPGVEERSGTPEDSERGLSAESQEETAPDTLHFIDAWGEWHDAVINPNVKMHDYDWNCLNNDGQKIAYDGDGRYTLRKGIDVSYHQGEIDWHKVKADGYSFAIIRIAYRGYGAAGALKLDSAGSDYIQQAHEAGLDVGVYVFSQAVNEAEAVEEAEFVIRALAGTAIELPVVFDPELIRDSEARTDHVTGEQFTANTIAFCQRIQEAGYQPMVYSNMIWESELFDMEQIDEYPIWYADYELIPQTPYAFTFWQYSESGQVDGISGYVDLDVQFMKN